MLPSLILPKDHSTGALAVSGDVHIWPVVLVASIPFTFILRCRNGIWVSRINASKFGLNEIPIIKKQ